MNEGEPTEFVVLVQKAKSGDRDAFGILYETYFTPVYRYVFMRLRSKEDAEEIAQDTFLRAWGAIERYEVTTDTFLPYLFTIARNLLINWNKKQKSIPVDHVDLERHTDGSDTSTRAREREMGEIVATALEKLTPAEREVIELKFFGERTYAEIALIIDKREDAIRQQLARALKKLRTHISEQP